MHKGDHEGFGESGAGWRLIQCDSLQKNKYFSEQPSKQPFAREKENRLLRRFVKCLFYWSYGGRGRNRTYNLSVKSRMLCQLSYASKQSKNRAKRNVAHGLGVRMFSLPLQKI
jgi:hypothetical protein